MLKGCHKAPVSHEEAMRVFREGDERVVPRAHFDPEVLTTFFRIAPMLEKIFESMEEKVYQAVE